MKSRKEEVAPLPVDPHEEAAKKLSVGQYLDKRLSDMEYNGDFGGGFGLNPTACAKAIFEEYIRYNGGRCPLRSH